MPGADARAPPRVYSGPRRSPGGGRPASARRASPSLLPLRRDARLDGFARPLGAAAAEGLEAPPAQGVAVPEEAFDLVGQPRAQVIRAADMRVRALVATASRRSLRST